MGCAKSVWDLRVYTLIGAFGDSDRCMLTMNLASAMQVWCPNVFKAICSGVGSVGFRDLVNIDVYSRIQLNCSLWLAGVLTCTGLWLI